MPLACLAILGLLAGFYLSRALDLESATVKSLEMMVERGSMTKEQMEQALPMALKAAGIQLIVLTAIGSLVVSLIVAGTPGCSACSSPRKTGINRFLPLPPTACSPSRSCNTP
jgi:hypothetical protein